MASANVTKTVSIIASQNWLYAFKSGLHVANYHSWTVPGPFLLVINQSKVYIFTEVLQNIVVYVFLSTITLILLIKLGLGVVRKLS